MLIYRIGTHRRMETGNGKELPAAMSWWAILLGNGIQRGKTNRAISTKDIAPTIAVLLNIQAPNGCVGYLITEITDAIKH
jgi:hypothetical protein